MSTVTIPTFFAVEVESVGDSLRQVRGGIGSAPEVVLDCSSMRRIDSAALRELELLAQAAEEKSVKVTLRGVHVEAYKVLKLARLASRFDCVE